MTNRLIRPSTVSAVLALLLAGAIFGFFYAWVCSTMWGLDAADPRVAIAAMQAMNASVRNAAFFPAFFLTPAALLFSALLAWGERSARAAWLLVGAAARIWTDYSARWQIFNQIRTIISGLALLLAAIALLLLGRRTVGGAIMR